MLGCQWQPDVTGCWAVRRGTDKPIIIRGFFSVGVVRLLSGKVAARGRY